LLNLDPRVRFVEMQSFSEVMEPLLRSWTLGATLFTVFGLLALLVAAFGLYAVIAFDVIQRTRELGIRAALGATSRAIIRAVIGRGLRLAGIGVAIGLFAAAMLAPRLEDMLYGVPARDPTTFLAVAGVLIFVALLAAWVPARRASRVDPAIALRAD
jgi:ABC-type antimicrobial peptide transport system permease subunit